MTPSAFVFLQTLPLSANGKIDRKALPMPDADLLADNETFVAPRSSVEVRLADIWQEMLGMSRVSADANFFALGGHSLLAIRLLTKIDREFHTRLSLAEVFKVPTVRQMAGLLQRKQKGEDVWSPLVSLQPLGDRPPLFCGPVGGGSTFYYCLFAEYIGSDQPLYVFEPIGLNGVDAPHTTIEEMATYYLRHMRTVQPQGPYRLGGFSLGGVIAYEMAQQLLATGEEVKCVILLDSHTPAHSSRWSGRSAKGLRHFLEAIPFKIRVHLENLTASPTLADKFAYARTKVKEMHRKWWQRKGSERRKLPRESTIRMVLPEVYEQVRLAEEQAARIYEPQSYPGRVALLRVRLQEPGAKADAMLGWEKLAPNIEVIPTPGTHSTLLDEPCVHIALTHVRKVLEDA